MSAAAAPSIVRPQADIPDYVVKRAKAGRKKLNVPCICWIYSQSPTRRGADIEMRRPIIVWWLEAVPPKFKKRKIYYSYLDEQGSPMRDNLSKAIRRSNAEFGARGFNIHCTNTYKYVYPVPKIRDTSGVPGDEIIFAGKNLWTDYDPISYIPSYVADEKQQIEQGIKVAGRETVLDRVRGTIDEQYYYRNQVINACQAPLQPGFNLEDLADPVCNTNAVPYLLEVEAFDQQAALLNWGLDPFLLYIADNTFENFLQAGLQSRAMNQASKEFALAARILFGDRDYKLINWDNNPRKPTLVTPPTRRLSPTVQDPNSRTAVRGLKYPNIVPPWTRRVPLP